LDRRPIWNQYIMATCPSTTQKVRKMRWLLFPGSGLSITAKSRLFKAILMPNPYWGIHLWGSVCNTSVKSIETCQAKILRHMINAEYKTTIFQDLKIKRVCTSITKTTTRYRSRLVSNTNRLALSLPRPMNRRRLKRFHPSDNWILGRPASGRLVLDSDALFATLPNFCNGPFFYYTTCKIY